MGSLDGYGFGTLGNAYSILAQGQQQYANVFASTAITSGTVTIDGYGNWAGQIASAVAKPEKPAPEKIEENMAWLDRRVDEIRVKL